MNNKITFHMICFLWASFLLSSVILANKINPVSTFRNGEMFQKNNVSIVILRGSYYEMGEQYGYLLKEKINNMYDIAIKKTFFDSGVTSFDHVYKDYALRVWQAMPARLKKIYLGVSKTSGLSPIQLVMTDGYLSIGLLHIEKVFGPNGVGACSFLSVGDSYTSDNKIIIGRNFDWLGQLQSNPENFVVTIFKPTDGSNQVATVGYAGSIGTFSGVNSKNLFLELNSGAHSVGISLYNNRASYKNEILGLLFDSDSLKGLSNRINTIRPDWPTIINVADTNSAITFENAPFSTREREEKDGLLIATNQFRLKDWGLPVREGPELTYSKKRYNNLEKQAKKYKGKINPEIMRKIFDTPLYNAKGQFLNGPTKTYPLEEQDLTVYQVVYDTATQRMWVKVPRHIEWTRIDLKDIFSRD